ncbi:TIGR04222 domain-containing membrane protein [Actinokineospora sp. G85]|uniref:TIGR04222 domain-containing membrane protein n=1 Tax=Actinokineospora sp. G85 TaxID=3406626 RepID=UPI003C7532FF
MGRFAWVDWGWVSAFTVVLAGALGARWHERSQASLRATRIAAGDEWAPLSMGLLTGGPRRAVDTVIVGLVDRGVLAAQAGVLTRAGATGTLSEPERTVVEAVGQGARLPALRLDTAVAEKSLLSLIYQTFRVRGLVVTPGWRRHLAAIAGTLALSGLGAALLILFGSPTTGPVPALGFACLVAIPAAALATRRGHWGHDPRTALGHRVSALLALRPSLALADTVGAQGITAIPDEALRAAILDTEPEGTWHPSTRSAANDLTELRWLGADLIQNKL